MRKFKNRDYKFRVWDGNTMSYCDDSYYFCIYRNGVHEVCNITEYCPKKYPNPQYADINQDSEDCAIMQYTGLKGKYGKEIYEGDILKVKFPDMDKLKKETSKVLYPAILEDFKDGYLIAEVIADFSEGWLSQFSYYLNGYMPIQKLKFLTSQDNVTVIGNIYENPELLQSNT